MVMVGSAWRNCSAILTSWIPLACNRLATGKPNLARNMSTLLRTDRLDPDPRLPRHARPPLGTQTVAPALARGRRPNHHHRNAQDPQTVETMALGRPAHRRPPALRTDHLTPNTRNYNPLKGPKRRRERNAGVPACPNTEYDPKTNQTHNTQPDERSRPAQTTSLSVPPSVISPTAATHCSRSP